MKIRLFSDTNCIRIEAAINDWIKRKSPRIERIFQNYENGHYVISVWYK